MGGIYSSAEQAILKKAGYSSLLDNGTGFLSYLTTAKNNDAADDFNAGSIQTTYPGYSYYVNQQNNVSRWNISSVKLTDGRVFDFSRVYDKQSNVPFQNQENYDKMKQIFNNPNIATSANPNKKVEVASILYDNGLRINKGDSMFMPYSGNSKNSPAAYHMDGTFNTELITSGLQIRNHLTLCQRNILVIGISWYV